MSDGTTVLQVLCSDLETPLYLVLDEFWRFFIDIMRRSLVTTSRIVYQ